MERRWGCLSTSHVFPPLTCLRCRGRSALCLLPLGCINPVLQLKHEMDQRNAAAAAAAVSGTSSTGELPLRALTSAASAALPASALHDVCPPGNLRDSMLLDDLWTWCQSCKHGGHASHLAEWFASKTVCPVAECLCHCTRLDRAGGDGSGSWQSNSMRRYGMSFQGGSVRLPAASLPTQ